MFINAEKINVFITLVEYKVQVVSNIVPKSKSAFCETPLKVRSITFQR